MNNFQIEDLLETAKERNHEDVDSQLAWKAMQGTSINRYRWLAALEPGWLQKVKNCRLVILQLCKPTSWGIHKAKPKKPERRIFYKI